VQFYFQHKIHVTTTEQLVYIRQKQEATNRNAMLS